MNPERDHARNAHRSFSKPVIREGQCFGQSMISFPLIPTTSAGPEHAFATRGGPADPGLTTLIPLVINHTHPPLPGAPPQSKYLPPMRLLPLSPALRGLALAGLLNAAAAGQLFAVTEPAVVLRDPTVRAALDAAKRNEPETVELQIMLNEIPAPPFGEAVRAAELKRQFERLGLKDVRIDTEGNVLGTRPGEQPTPHIVVAAHLDTVFPEGTDVRVRREGAVLHAPGIADDTRGLAEMLGVIRALDEGKVVTKGTITFVGTVGEEGLGDLRGVTVGLVVLGGATVVAAILTLLTLLSLVPATGATTIIAAWARSGFVARTRVFVGVVVAGDRVTDIFDDRVVEDRVVDRRVVDLCDDRSLHPLFFVGLKEGGESVREGLSKIKSTS